MATVTMNTSSDSDSSEIDSGDADTVLYGLN